MCECFRIGGSFIAEDPDCPVHGAGSQGREERLAEILRRFAAGEIGSDDAIDAIESQFR